MEIASILLSCGRVAAFSSSGSEGELLARHVLLEQFFNSDTLRLHYVLSICSALLMTVTKQYIKEVEIRRSLVSRTCH
jgi:hypothetical protein